MNDYSYDEFEDALRSLGIGSGQVVFTHSNVGFFGRVDDITNVCKNITTCILNVIGENGTFVVPTFSYSFCNKENFDPDITKTVCGMLSEHVLAREDSARSLDPNFSVSAIGKNAAFLIKDVSDHSFGIGSFWERFIDADGVICNMNFDAGSTMVHYVEKMVDVPYRFDKRFTGKLCVGKNEIDRVQYHYARDLANPETKANFSKLHSHMRASGVARQLNVGRGTIVAVKARDVYNTVVEQLRNDSSFLIFGK